MGIQKLLHELRGIENESVVLITLNKIIWSSNICVLPRLNLTVFIFSLFRSWHWLIIFCVEVRRDKLQSGVILGSPRTATHDGYESRFVIDGYESQLVSWLWITKSKTVRKRCHSKTLIVWFQQKLYNLYI